MHQLTWDCERYALTMIEQMDEGWIKGFVSSLLRITRHAGVLSMNASQRARPVGMAIHANKQNNYRARIYVLQESAPVFHPDLSHYSHNNLMQ